MRRAWVGVAFALGLFAGNLLALDAVDTVTKVDAGKGVLVIHANGPDRTVKVAKDAKVLRTDGQVLADRLRAPDRAGRYLPAGRCRSNHRAISCFIAGRYSCPVSLYSTLRKCSPLLYRR
jgi:hypothetical protein